MRGRWIGATLLVAGVLVAAALGAALTASPAGALSFRCIDSFGHWGMYKGQFREPLAVAVGPDGNVFVVDNDMDNVQRFRPSGAFVSRFVLPTRGAGAMTGAWGIAVDPQGRLYLHVWGDVKRYRPSGSGFVYDATILDDRDPNSEVSTIVGMGMDPNGTSLYVTGFYNGGYLFWYGVDGVLKGVWPTSNFGDGTPGLSSGSRVAVGPDGSVYVIERGTRSVRKFTTSLTPATSWGGAGTASGKFRFDGNDDGIACDRQGRVYVVDGKNHRVQVFDADGQFLAKFGTAGSKGLGRFVTPTGIAVARNGRVYVVDAGRCNVQVFVPR